MSSSKGGWSVSDVTGSLLLDSEPALCIRSSSRVPKTQIRNILGVEVLHHFEARPVGSNC